MAYIILLLVVILLVTIVIATKKEKRRQDEQLKEESRLREELYRQQELQRQVELEEQELQEERRKEELRKQEEEKEKLIISRLDKLGAEYKRTDNNKIHIIVLDDCEIKEVMYYGRQIGSLKGCNSITYDICDNENVPVASLLYEENYAKGKYSFICTIRYVEESSVLVVNKDFFSDCCNIVKNQLFCYFQNRKIKLAETMWNSILEEGVNNISRISIVETDIEKRILSILNQSNYKSLFEKDIYVAYSNSSVIINYRLPNRENFLRVKEYKYISKSNEIVEKLYLESFIAQLYEKSLYSICLRSIYEVFNFTNVEKLNNVTFNGYVNHINRSVGKEENKCILSLYVNRGQFEGIEIKEVEPKLCFKSLKGVSAAKLVDIVAITPIITFDKKDRRFIESKNINVNKGTNLAIMEWSEFEQLVRELFELEFSKVGGEVRVTQASRDGGVDAVIYDPDPIRGGKIVIQAKRYTNTVGVAAVRDLYGTVINEGANSGILITTSDYGNDSYEFARNKPLKLLNGGHLLGLLERHGKQAYIDIKEAKDIINTNL